MSKLQYSESFKLEVVNYLLAGHSVLQAMEKFSVDRSSAKKWLSAYEIHGVEGLRIKQHSPNRYTGEFKINVIEYKLLHHLSIRQATAYFNIPSSRSIALWERKYLEGGAEALMVETRGSGSLRTGVMKGKKAKFPVKKDESLEEENKRLRMENEYLKKLNALIQEKEESKKKIK